MKTIKEVIETVDEAFFDRVFDRIGGIRLSERFPELDGVSKLADYLLRDTHIIELKVIEDEFLGNSDRIEREYSALLRLRDCSDRETIDLTDETLPKEAVYKYMDAKFDQLKAPIRSAKKQVQNAKKALGCDCQGTLFLVNKHCRSVSYKELFDYTESYLKRKDTGIQNLLLLSLNPEYSEDQGGLLFPTRISNVDESTRSDLDRIRNGIFQEFGPVIAKHEKLVSTTHPLSNGLKFMSEKGTSVTFKTEYPTTRTVKPS